MKRLALFILTLLTYLGGCVSGVALSQGKGSFENEALALVGAKIYPSPTEEPIINGLVLVNSGKVVAVGQKDKMTAPQGPTVLDCSGLTMMAGFWNSHVHFVRPEWSDAARMPARQLNERLQDMLVRYGFTWVFEAATFSIDNTGIIRKRIESQEVDGPKILTAGAPIFSKNGTPFYIEPLLQQLKITPSAYEISSPREAISAVKDKIARGADAIKIFTASPASNGETVVMPPEMVKAITAEAHRYGKKVIAHPHNRDGMIAAIEGGVDILAHTAPNAGVWDDSLVRKLRRANIALIPTLKLMRLEEADPGEGEKVVSVAVGQLGAYARAGGQIIFGTDAGYINDYDPTEEYALMARAGMSFRQILASLTTSPAERFGLSRQVGRIRRGMAADLVLVEGDPQKDISALSKIRYVVRAGRIIYSRE